MFRPVGRSPYVTDTKHDSNGLKGEERVTELVFHFSVGVAFPAPEIGNALKYQCMSSPPISSAPLIGAEPQLVRIPDGWFWMGSETGQDNERPLHRVWVDEFRLASCAVTNASYAQFVRATGNPPAPFR